ncbi:uncharacterized protein LOC122068384 isoform X2 [Macadamia integrifolia]|uniref:uncharacterized protein LOC122068384 isoform X2 n=1 Tax=Macadamia integrifolia TaxID=60698 RepID=UPI001C4F1787|nr:uncharacterized protein LOC122068384 isoform X2 [Macadamia integrifolia]
MGTVLDSHFLALTAIVTVGYQLLFFILTALLKFDKVTDFAGSTNFVIIAILTLVLKGTWHFRQIILTLFVVIWGLRLAGFLLMRNPSVQAVDIIGWILWSIGVIIEAIADQQKLVFKNSPNNRGKWCNVGVWKFSRHPNYFGEILLWWGIFAASAPVLKGAEWLVIVGPIFLTMLLLFVSGIPLLEESADKKFGNMAEYKIYKRTTSPLILLPPVVYGKLPAWFKATFLFELPLYSRNIPQDETSNLHSNLCTV